MPLFSQGGIVFLFLIALLSCVPSAPVIDAAVAAGSDSDEEPRQSKPKAASKPAAKRAKKSEDGGGKKGGGGGYTKPVKVTPELAALVGTDSISRPELTKFFWGYFREHNLFVSIVAQLSSYNSSAWHQSLSYYLS
jgi:hypothetical protein